MHTHAFPESLAQRDRAAMLFEKVAERFVGKILQVACLYRGTIDSTRASSRRRIQCVGGLVIHSWDGKARLGLRRNQ
jgi:hypothetical protein